MAIHVIKTPDIGEGIAEVELVAWHVKPGDVVVEDQALADVMTEKANVEIPSPVAGKVLSLAGEIGQTVAVGAELIRIEIAGAAEASAGDETQATQPAITPLAVTSPAVTPLAVTSPAVTPLAVTPPAVTARAVTASAVTAPRQSTAPLAGTARPPSTALPHEPASRAVTERPLASPSVRKRARDRDIDLRSVSGSGRIGQITHEDLDRHEAAQKDQAPALRDRPPPNAPRTDEARVPVVGIRRKIAERMQEAKRRIPHFTYVEELDVTELEALRTKLNAGREAAKAGSSARLSPLVFIARAIVRAVRDFPQINARFDDDAGVVTRHGAVHLGVATQTGNGLVVPVVRHAESLDLWQTADAIARLASAARDGKATRDELSGSTITVSSLGALGGIVSTPIINRPEVAIVGVNRIVERPMLQRGAVVPRLVMNLSSSFDHRVVDGMDAAEFVQAIRVLLEAPALLFMAEP